MIPSREGITYRCLEDRQVVMPAPDNYIRGQAVAGIQSGKDEAMKRKNHGDRVDKVVKSPKQCHSRAGGSPEPIKNTESKSALISRLRGNDDFCKRLFFYKKIHHSAK